MRLNIKYLFLCIFCILLLVLSFGCATVTQVKRAENVKLSEEGTVVFVRPDSYSVIGTRSLEDYLEVAYEHPVINDAGLLEIRIGLRNKGGKYIYDVTGVNFNLSAKTIFYSNDIRNGQRNFPIYETNWRDIRMLRGAITDFRVVCPKKGARFYQVLLSERLGSLR